MSNLIQTCRLNSDVTARSSAFIIVWSRKFAGDEGNWEKFSRLFPDNDDYEAWRFSRIHRIVLGLLDRDLEQELLEPDVDIDCIDLEGRTTLFWASGRGDAKAVSLLLRARADVNKTNRRGRSSLMRSRDLPCLKLLLEAGADVRAAYGRGESILHQLPTRLARSQIPRAVSLLMSAGADIDAKDRWGSTPLAKTAVPTYYDIQEIAIDTLLSHGAAVDSLDCDGDTALNTALFYHQNKAVTLLLQHGAAYNLVNKNGDSVLHMVAKCSDLRIIEVLNAAAIRDVDTEILNKLGRTARQEAAERVSKPEGFLEKFDELLASIYNRSKGSYDATTDRWSTEDNQGAEVDGGFVDAMEQQ